MLTSTEWEQHFSKTTVVALSREISDHTPLFLDTGEDRGNNKQPQFKFEPGWLMREGFFDLVPEVWTKEQKGSNALQRWQNKITRLRQFLRGWDVNMQGAYKKEKKELLRKAEELDIKVESGLLNQ